MCAWHVFLFWHILRGCVVCFGGVDSNTSGSQTFLTRSGVLQGPLKSSEKTGQTKPLEALVWNYYSTLMMVTNTLPGRHVDHQRRTSKGHRQLRPSTHEKHEDGYRPSLLASARHGSAEVVADRCSILVRFSTDLPQTTMRVPACCCTRLPQHPRIVSCEVCDVSDGSPTVWTQEGPHNCGTYRQLSM